jgi:hypothetical protein
VNERRTIELVSPFYLDFMGRTVTPEQVELIPVLVAAGRTTTPAEVVALLRSAWRESCMGAWYSYFHDPSTVGGEVAAALQGSYGVLNSCALTVLAVELLGVEAVPSVAVYAERDLAGQFGGWGFAAAALEHLGRAPDCGNVGNVGEPTENDRAEFAALLAFAQQLRAAI